MKRKLIAVVIAALTVVTPFTAFASEEDAEMMPHLDTEYGVYDLLGCDFFTYNDDNVIVIFSNYENTTDENTYPSSEYTIKAFQDGVKLDGFYSMSRYDASATEWKDAKSSTTELQPGGSALYYTGFKLESDSDITIEVSALWDWSDEIETVSYTFECGDAVSSGSGDSDEESVDYEAMYNELLKEYEQLKADYDALKKE